MLRRALGLSALCVCAATAAAQDPAPPVAATEQPVTFPAAGEDGPLLEGELTLPERADRDALVPGVVICHPNPLMGGTMHNRVVLALRQRLRELGMATLIFNFRGVGASQGTGGGGQACADDVLGALSFLRAQPAVDGSRVGIAGYSFGAAMALRGLGRDPLVPACVAIGFPTGLDPVNIAEFAYLQDIERPLLFAVGTDDRYSSIPNTRLLIEHYELKARLLPIEGADHFYTEAQDLATMASAAARFLAAELTGEM